MKNQIIGAPLVPVARNRGLRHFLAGYVFGVVTGVLAALAVAVW